MIGELGLYCFVVLVLTGVYLVLLRPQRPPVVYDGSYGPLRGVEMTEAYRSALELSFDVRAGLVCGRSTTGRRCCSWRPWPCTWPGCSSPARSAGLASSTGSSAARC